MAICQRHKNVAPEVTSTGNNLCIINRTVTPPFGDRKSNWLWPPLWENTLCPIQQDILNRCPHELFLETSRKNRTIKHQYAYLTLTLDCENELLERLKLLHDCRTQAAKLLTYTPNLVAIFFYFSRQGRDLHGDLSERRFYVLFDNSWVLVGYNIDTDISKHKCCLISLTLGESFALLLAKYQTLIVQIRNKFVYKRGNPLVF